MRATVPQARRSGPGASSLVVWPPQEFGCYPAPAPIPHYPGGHEAFMLRTYCAVSKSDTIYAGSS